MVKISRIKSPFACFACGVLLASATTASPAETQPGDEQLPAAYAIFRTVNPFSPGHHSTVVQARGGPEASIILAGVVQAGSGWTAFLRTEASSPMLMLSVGDSVALGRISAIDLDSITYSSNDHCQRVEVGQNLCGQAPPPPASRPAPAVDAAAGKPSPDSPPPHGRKHQPPAAGPADGDPAQPASPQDSHPQDSSH